MRKLIALVMTVVVLAVGVVVTLLDEFVPVATQYGVDVPIGQDTEVGPVTMHVRDVWATQQVATSSDPEDLTQTDNVWIVADVSYAARHSTEYFATEMIVDAQGRQYQRAASVGTSLQVAEPGLWRVSRIVFEVPQDALGELTLRIGTFAPNTALPAPYASTTVVVTDIDPEPVDPRFGEFLAVDER